MSQQPPADLKRELEQVRAASTPQPAPPPTVGRFLMQSTFRMALLWAGLITVFYVIWVFLNKH